MNSEQFAAIFDEQVLISRDMLFRKAAEYATDDERLHNFKVASEILGTDPARALGGMMVKHTTSVYDMIQAGDPNQFTLDLWDEKISDHINYLILLRAVVYEIAANSKTTNESETPST